MQLHVIQQASKAKLIQETGFGAYDVCLNPYVGCQIGCTYCYVRFFVKDPNHPWGGFTRVRDFIGKRLPKELPKLNGKRLAIGTMTDPYQPAELQYRLTRTTLQMIADSPYKPREVGLFTRSPLAKHDTELLQKLNARIHITVTPFAKHILKRLEPLAISTAARFKMAKHFVDAGLRTHIAVSPVIPIWSDPHTQHFVDMIASIKPSGFTIDPMQVYGEAFEATEKACHDLNDWNDVVRIIQNKKRYNEWKTAYVAEWRRLWEPHIDLPVKPIAMDHVKHMRSDLRTGERFDFHDFDYDEN